VSATILPFKPPSEPQDKGEDVPAVGERSREEQASIVARQLLYISRSLCFEDAALADDALRRAALLVGAPDRGSA
jgi:hypothetical protein